MTLDPATSREGLNVSQQLPSNQMQNGQNRPPPHSNDNRPPENQNESNITKPIVGIIYPPPEHRNIIDKTAMFVARNGPDFEDKVRQNEVSNSKFNFFNATDPYHAYYQHKIKEFREGKVQDIAPAKPMPSSNVLAQQEKIKQQVVAEMAVPKEAPPDFEFIADPPSISGQELDIVKLTAQFVARNGRHFLTQLMNREQRNPQFDFLRPQHGMFQYFTKLVEQYTKVLIPPKDLVDTLEMQSLSIDPMVQEAKRRADWKKHIEKQKQKEADEQERERVAYAQIDWHDFVIVETVDFQAHETLGLPPPVTPGTVGARVIHQQRTDEKKRLGIADEEPTAQPEGEGQDASGQKDGVGGAGVDEGAGGGGADMDLEDMEESDEEEGDDNGQDEDEDDDEQTAAAQVINQNNQPAIQPLAMGGEDLLIRKDYDPKMKQPTTSNQTSQLQNYVINEITGEKVPIDKMNQHVKYNLLDPRWIEEKERQKREKQQQEEVFAIGNQIGDSLRQLAERRTDIFGAGDEETVIGRRLGEEEEEKRDERAIWDGHTGSVESTTKRIQANITIQDQIEAIHKAKGLAEDSSKEKIGPHKTGLLDIPSGSSAGEPVAPKDSILLPGSGVAPPAVRPPLAHPTATPLLVPIVPVVQRPPMVPVFNPNPAAAMLGAQAAMLRPNAGLAAGLTAMHNQNLAVAALAAQQANQLAAAVAEKNAQAQAAVAAASSMKPPGSVAPPPKPPQAPPAQSKSQASAVINEDLSGPSAAKKPRGEADLIPEAAFLQSRTSPNVTINVSIPTDYSKPEWNLNGQTISITLPYKDYVSVIKEKVFEKLTLPSGKQKLVYDGMFIKDSNTLAFYNMSDNCSVVLQLKERGGRKK